MLPVDVSDVTALLSPEGRALLDSLPPYRDDDALALTGRLRRKGHAPELVAVVLTQARLRQRARAKFGDLAETLFFTQAGYEQSSRWSVAQTHAAQFARAGARHIVDIGCGIGADSLAFCNAGLRVTAIESDPATALIARANLPAATVLCEDGLTAMVPDADAVWLDPARRTTTGRRIKDPQSWSPTYGQALDIAASYRYSGIKVAPGIPHSILPAQAHVVWTSEGRELLEAVVWQGTGTPGRYAVVDGVAFDSGATSADQPVTPSEPSPLRALLLEPDPALIRAGSIAQLCRTYGVAPVSDGIAYLTGDNSLPGCDSFAIREVLRNDVKDIKRALEAHGIGALEIKKRGTDTDIELLRKRIGKRTGRPGVLILTPVLGRHRVILAERLPGDGSS